MLRSALMRIFKTGTRARGGVAKFQAEIQGTFHVNLFAPPVTIPLAVVNPVIIIEHLCNSGCITIDTVRM